MYGINAIKEENVEESSIYYDCSENKNKNMNIEEKNNKLRNNKLKEERDHSTSVSSNPQISNSKSNISIIQQVLVPIHKYQILNQTFQPKK